MTANGTRTRSPNIPRASRTTLSYQRVIRFTGSSYLHSSNDGQFGVAPHLSLRRNPIGLSALAAHRLARPSGFRYFSKTVRQ